MTTFVEIERHHAGELLAKIFPWTHTTQKNLGHSLESPRKRHSSLITKLSKWLNNQRIERKVISLWLPTGFSLHEKNYTHEVYKIQEAIFRPTTSRGTFIKVGNFLIPDGTNPISSSHWFGTTTTASRPSSPLTDT